jgi:hypothetical protein
MYLTAQIRSDDDDDMISFYHLCLPLKDTLPVTFSIGQHKKKQPGY